jgi:hypothetical protein
MQQDIQKIALGEIIKHLCDNVPEKYPQLVRLTDEVRELDMKERIAKSRRDRLRKEYLDAEFEAKRLERELSRKIADQAALFMKEWNAAKEMASEKREEAA